MRSCRDTLGRVTLVEKLEAGVARATAVTMGTDATTDADAVLAELNLLWTEIGNRPVEMFPVIERIATQLTAALANAPAPATNALATYREAVATARFDPVEPPREVVAFLVLDALERIREHCYAARN